VTDIHINATFEYETLIRRTLAPDAILTLYLGVGPFPENIRYFHIPDPYKSHPFVCPARAGCTDKI
jgi:hypothetical protein